MSYVSCVFYVVGDTRRPTTICLVNALPHLFVASAVPKPSFGVLLDARQLVLLFVQKEVVCVIQLLGLLVFLNVVLRCHTWPRCPGDGNTWSSQGPLCVDRPELIWIRQTCALGVKSQLGHCQRHVLVVANFVFNDWQTHYFLD